ncbi:ferrochelatase [Synechococcus phage S-H9-2]|jgi:hypothetical protein|uniref:Ferrochelatase n=1 Tax=Synechococcus phage S-H9-2 TaxID=2783669 RepID=A0A873WB79_9CAUD|nr:ferrochelatase [Synechococcus phage S-H9-2]QPB08469.1 ferrochelatase [Synechococcus phage S-H9-2]
MNKQISTCNYQIVRNFIDADKAQSLNDEFLKFAKYYCLSGDLASANSWSQYQYLPAIEMCTHNTQRVSELCGESLLPTYGYARTYKHLGELTKHRDRPACDVSITLHLGGDQDWDIWIETPEEERVSVLLQPGDAMLYLGCVAAHWRTPYQGEYYTQMFLHYVRTYGPYADYFFDNQANFAGPKKYIYRYNSGDWK